MLNKISFFVFSIDGTNFLKNEETSYAIAYLPSATNTLQRNNIVLPLFIFEKKKKRTTNTLNKHKRRTKRPASHGERKFCLLIHRVYGRIKLNHPRCTAQFRLVHAAGGIRIICWGQFRHLVTYACILYSNCQAINRPDRAQYCPRQTARANTRNGAPLTRTFVVGVARFDANRNNELTGAYKRQTQVRTSCAPMEIFAQFEVLPLSYTELVFLLASGLG